MPQSQVKILNLLVCKEKHSSTSTQGYVSIRDKQDGSWFIQMLYKVFNEHYGEAHLEDLLKLTSIELGKLKDDDLGKCVYWLPKKWIVAI